MSPMHDALRRLCEASCRSAEAAERHAVVNCCICMDDSKDVVFLSSHNQSVCFHCLTQFKAAADVLIRRRREQLCCQHSPERWTIIQHAGNRVCGVCQRSVRVSDSSCPEYMLNCSQCLNGGFDVCQDCALEFDGQKTLGMVFFQKKPRCCPFCRGRLEVCEGTGRTFRCSPVEERAKEEEPWPLMRARSSDGSWRKTKLRKQKQRRIYSGGSSVPASEWEEEDEEEEEREQETGEENQTEEAETEEEEEEEEEARTKWHITFCPHIMNILGWTAAEDAEPIHGHVTCFSSIGGIVSQSRRYIQAQFTHFSF
eukprot:TRINITY_DN307_c0_g1_i4.p1 TRINITY_DN307_c0_g1~~TRINITY_DN307_c0_g1_i4.p1  ORF type:complete len:312 (+),score=46.02 TRINITY_DN307_c0_g1_i4:75-1010(+)